MSRDHAIALQPGQQERNFVSKNKTKQNKKMLTGKRSQAEGKETQRLGEGDCARVLQGQQEVSTTRNGKALEGQGADDGEATLKGSTGDPGSHRETGSVAG